MDFVIERNKGEVRIHIEKDFCRQIAWRWGEGGGEKERVSEGEVGATRCVFFFFFFFLGGKRFVDAGGERSDSDERGDSRPPISVADTNLSPVHSQARKFWRDGNGVPGSSLRAPGEGIFGASTGKLSSSPPSSSSSDAAAPVHCVSPSPVNV